MRYPENAREPHIWTVSLSQNGAKIKKTTDHDYNLTSIERGQVMDITMK